MKEKWTHEFLFGYSIEFEAIGSSGIYSQTTMIESVGSYDPLLSVVTWTDTLSEVEYNAMTATLSLNGWKKDVSKETI